MVIENYIIKIDGDLMIVTDTNTGKTIDFEVTEEDFNYWAEWASKKEITLSEQLVEVIEEVFEEVEAVEEVE